MNIKNPSANHLGVHLTNVSGTGAIQLLQSLLPALEKNATTFISEMYLPNHGDLAKYQKLQLNTRSIPYRRWLPNTLSRFLECMVLARFLVGNSPLLVLGDLPLRCKAPQTVFVQTPHLIIPKKIIWSMDGLKFVILRFIFRINAKFARAFIVQTPFMREALSLSYPAIANKIHIISQPPPSWLLGVSPRNAIVKKHKLNLIYPSAGYPHKNHKLLASLNTEVTDVWPINYLNITLPIDQHPAPNVTWIRCVGFLSPLEMIKSYQETDGLIFLSTDESYGFPLVEAMYMGLPIVCPDLPYARVLCGGGAIYFDPHSIDSLLLAIQDLHSRISSGWKPDWSSQMSAIPKDWDEVAEAMINISCFPR